jgi:hypothetical protein
LMIVAAAYFFLGTQQTAVSTSSVNGESGQLQTETLARIPPPPLNKSIDASPLKLSADATKQPDKKVVVQSTPATKQSPPTKQAPAPAPANRQTKAASPGEILYLPPGATAASAAATAAAIAEAIGKRPPPAQPAGKPAPEVAVVKGTGSAGAPASPPVPCTEALAALGLCIIQAAPQPKP